MRIATILEARDNGFHITSNDTGAILHEDCGECIAAQALIDQGHYYPATMVVELVRRAYANKSKTRQHYGTGHHP